MCCSSKQSEACAHFSPFMRGLVSFYGSLKHTHPYSVLSFSYYAVFQCLFAISADLSRLWLPLLFFLSLSAPSYSHSYSFILSHHPLSLHFFSGPVISPAELLCPSNGVSRTHHPPHTLPFHSPPLSSVHFQVKSPVAERLTRLVVFYAQAGSGVPPLPIRPPFMLFFPLLQWTKGQIHCSLTAHIHIRHVILN